MWDRKGVARVSTRDNASHALRITHMGGFPKLGVPFGGPHSKDYKILGSILGSPYFGKLPYPERSQGWFNVTLPSLDPNMIFDARYDAEGKILGQL